MIDPKKSLQPVKSAREKIAGCDACKLFSWIKYITIRHPHRAKEGEF
jgi:hypothetical protein